MVRLLPLFLLPLALAACKPQTAPPPAPQTPSSVERIRLAVWPDEETRWRVCEDTWAEFAQGGYLREDVTAAMMRYVLPVPFEGVEGQFHLALPLAFVVGECGRLALEGTRPYRPSNRPPVGIFQPVLIYWGPQEPPGDWAARLTLLAQDGYGLAYVEATRLDEPLCLLGECEASLVFPFTHPSGGETLEGSFFLDALGRGEGEGLGLEMEWGEAQTAQVVDLKGVSP